MCLLKKQKKSTNLSGNGPKRGNSLAQGTSVRFKTHLWCFLRTQIQTRKPAQCTRVVALKLLASDIYIAS